jgi:hypothetical protein
VDEGCAVEGCEDHIWEACELVRYWGERSYLHIFQLIFHNKGGTANARIQFQNQLEAVASETALARILVGKISEG